MPPNFDLVSFGEILFDVYPDKKVLAGAPLNTASTAAKYGLKVALISAVNKDDYSDIKKILEKRKVHPFIDKTDLKTGKSIITLNKNKVPKFKIDKYCSFDEIKKIPNFKADFFHFGSLCQRNKISRNTLYKFLKNTKAKIIYDVNYRRDISDFGKILTNSIEYANIVKVNTSELKILQKHLKKKDIIKFLLSKPKIKSVFVTAGKNGASLYTKNTKVSVPAKKIKVIDTTGAGDAFVAGIVLGYKNKLSSKELLRQAVDIATTVAAYKGAYQ